MYRQLNTDKIISTVEILNKRISERFPQSGLEKVSWELLQITKEARIRSIWVKKPVWALRISVGIIVGIMLLSVALTFTKLNLPSKALSIDQFLQVSESAINGLVLIGAAVVFLVTIETRIKRKRILNLIHELRALAHVVDMHQLTKDPEALLLPYQMTTSSPKRTMTVFQLQRYLDYCSELLSLIGKIAALYVQDFNDSAIVAGVNEIENLTTGLSRKIWQKIIMLQQYPKEKSDFSSQPVG